jgi:hypothetical protein
MSEGRNNSPSWVLHLVSAVATVVTVYATIREEVPKVVRNEVHAELASQTAVMAFRQDSMWNAISDQLIQRTEALAANSVDSMAKAVGIMVMDRSRIVYSPHINVQADTVMAQHLNAKLDTVLHQLRQVRGQVAQQSARTKNTRPDKGTWQH